MAYTVISGIDETNTEKRSLSEIEHRIDIHQNILSSWPRFHPQRARELMCLAGLRSTHFRISASRNQLDQAILHLTEALLLPSRTGLVPNAALPLIPLTQVLYLRWSNFEQPDDIKYCIKYLRYLRGQQLQARQRKNVTTFLVLALAGSEREGSMSNNVVENIKEMTILCREFLTSEGPPVLPFEALTKVITAVYGIAGELLDQVIECLREANARFPSSPHLSFMLGNSLALRFSRAFMMVDYEEAVAILGRIVLISPSSSDYPEDIRVLHQRSLKAIADSSYHRYYTYGKPEHLEEAISHIHTYMGSIPLNHRTTLDFPELADLAQSRVRGYTKQLGSHNRLDTFDFSSLIASLTEPNSSSIPREQWRLHYQALSA
ncbi:hypothetical protein BGW80DRAFT_1447903 [Lactifluus volemus]|nr:hypothetical protein BGW80DRAFT_1447903 [Lactifluus volemus]